MKDRVFGTETEFGERFVSSDDGTPIIERDSSDEAKKVQNILHHVNHRHKMLLRDIIPGCSIFNSIWLSNGARVYVDIGAHPEYATPECRRVRDLVAHEKAGEWICTEIFGRSIEGTNMLLFKHNLAPSSSLGDYFLYEDKPFCTFGCHENYFLHYFDRADVVNGSNITSQRFRKHILPFLATRQIFCGAGGYTPRGRFIFSPRALGVEYIFGGGNNPGVSMVRDREESHMGKNIKGCRLQIQSGDSNMLEPTIFLRTGTMHILLSMLEDERDINNLELNDPIDTLHQVNEDGENLGKSPVVCMKNGEMVSALYVQEVYLDKAKKYVEKTNFNSEESRKEAYAILYLWEEALNAIARNDEGWMLGNLDWATKRFISERSAAKKPKKASEIKNTRDVFYHEIVNREIYSRLEETFASKRIVSSEEIKDSISSPPRDTRAFLRGKFVSEVVAQIPGFGIQENHITVDWHKVMFFNKKFLLNDPLSYSYKELERFIKKRKKRTLSG